MKIFNFVAVAALVSTGILCAAEDKVAASDKAPDAAQPDTQDMQVGASAQVFGKITSMHTVEMVGSKEAHVLVKLESAPGDVEIVDLGSAEELKTNGIEPRQGLQLWVDGRVGKINGKPLVVAETLSESKLVAITRQSPLREESVKHADARQADAAKTATEPKDAKDAKDPRAPKVETADAGQQVRMIEGTVVHTRHVKIEGEASEHVLAKVQTENGIVVLDLGLAPSMPANVDLAEGKPVAASGIVGQLNGKPIIIAESIGNVSMIQRTTEPAKLPTSAPATVK